MPILARAINRCWVVFKWTVVLAVVAGAVAFPFLYRRVDEEIRRRVETRIAQHYHGLKVSLRSAELVDGTGIRIRDLSIVEPGAEGPHAELLHIEEAILECPTEWKELVKGDPEVRRVKVRRPTLRVTHLRDGGWSTGKLLPPPQFGEQPPEVSVEGGVIEVLDPLKSPASELTLRDVNLALLPEPVTQSGVIPNARRLQGMLVADGLRRVEFKGLVDLKAATCSISGQVEGLEISPELRDSLPNPLGAKLLALGAVRGQGDLRFDLSYDPTAVLPLKYDISGRLVRGRLDDSRLPHALTDIRATVRVNNGGWIIDDLAAHSGQGVLRMSCRQTGFVPTSPLSLTAEVRQLDLDRALLSILPQSLQDQWHKYRPSGEVDADVQLSFDGKQWRPEMAVRCLNVSFTHHKFPYRLDHGKGTLDLKNDLLKLNLTAYAGTQPVRLAAEITNPFADSIGWFEAKGEEIQVDKTLIDALRNEKIHEVVCSLDPRGTINVDARLWRDKPNEAMHQRLRIEPNRCSIRYDKFPYPIGDIRGSLEMFDGNWTFRNLEGSNDKARVTCEGSLMPGLQGNELLLTFVGKDVPLEESLRDALSPHIQQVWRDVRPRGTVDLTAEIRYLSEAKTFGVSVRVEPQRESASIEPVHFPYRLDHLQGVLVYRDGHVTFDRFKAEHGSAKIATEGYCDFLPDGRWGIHFDKLSADRLRPDRELIQALPERLRKVVVELNPTGSANPVNLRGSLEFQRTGRSDEPLRSKWNVTVGLQQASLQFGGISLENIHGEVWLLGGFDGQQTQARGELNMESLNYKDCQFTKVKGPIWIDDGRVLFGAWVDSPENRAKSVELTGPARPPLNIRANLAGGVFDVKGWATLGAEPRYGLNATLMNADLARCAQELATGRQNLRGKITATADLTGTGRTRNRLSGKGSIQLSEGDVYQLPVMISLLKILSIRPPDQNAFSNATVNYRIEGEHIYLDPIDFQGDAISLHGNGEMDFQSNIRMTFHATVGRGELDLPVVKQVFSGASQQIMLIHVDGTLQNPETTKEALPGVNRALQLFQGEPQNRN